MKIVIIGGSGLIGSKVAAKLQQRGHEVIAASPSMGINSVTGEGLDAALSGADVLVDLANSPSFEEQAVMDFFTKAGRNLAVAGRKAGVKHYIILSVVGSDRLPDNTYLRAKVAQEKLIKEAGLPYTIVRSTQFFEFIDGIAYGGTEGDVVRISPALFQPIAAEDVSDAMVDTILAKPVNGTIEIAGPDKVAMDDLVRRHLGAKKDPRKVVADVHARYFGSVINDQSLNPTGAHPRLGRLDYAAWAAAQ